MTTEKIDPSPDILPPIGNELVFGWGYSVTQVEVYEMWTTNIFHGRGKVRGNGSQGSKSLYSTKKLALAALRSAIQKRHTEALRQDLATVDKLIQQEEKG